MNFSPVGVVELGIGEFFFATEAVELCLYQLFLVDVEAFVLVFIDPEVGVHMVDVVGHESCEDGVAGVLGGGGEDGRV